jgi:hypothetical protein
MFQLPLLENAYFLLAVIRSYFPGFADEELRMHMRASLPWYTRVWVPLVYRVVVRLFGNFGAWDGCGPESGDLCRHNVSMPAWMREGRERR